MAPAWDCRSAAESSSRTAAACGRAQIPPVVPCSSSQCRSGLANLRIHEFVFSARQDELKYGAARFVRICPQPPPMRSDDGTADRQPHPGSVALRSVESVENEIEIFRSPPRPGIGPSLQVSFCLVLFRADQQLSWPRLNRAHCFDRVQYQVQDDLLQLNTITPNGSQALRKGGLE